jgi:hypothetical protein
MSDKIFRTFLNLTNPDLPKDFKTDHFSNGELQVLVNAFSGGNILNSPTSIGELAEYFYKFETDKEAFKDIRVQQMWRDGLCFFLVTLCEMIDKKKPGFLIE